MNKRTTKSRTEARGARAGYRDCWQLRTRTAPPAETVREWIRAYRSTGCLDSRQKVIEAHMQLIAHFAKKCASNRAPFDDLMAEGAVILMRSIDLYDMDRGVPFAAYAAAALKVGLLGASARTHEAWRARAALERRMRAAARKASATGQPVVQPVEMPAAPQRCESPEVILSLADNGSTPIEEVQRTDAVERMQHAIGQLSPASAAILCKRFGVMGEREHSTRELGEQMGVEPRVVNRLLLRAIEELRRFLSVPRIAAA